MGTTIPGGLYYRGATAVDANGVEIIDAPPPTPDTVAGAPVGAPVPTLAEEIAAGVAKALAERAPVVAPVLAPPADAGSEKDESSKGKK